MRYALPFITFLLFAFYGDSWRCHAQELVYPSPAYVVPSVYAQPIPVQRYAPRVIYQPQVQWVPYQYQGTQVYRRDYRTPLRNMLFGKYRAYDYYAPLQPNQVQQ